MSAETRKLFQIVLAVALVAAAVRLLVIYRGRHSAPVPAAQREAPLDPDYYVTTRKLHAYDLPSARELTRAPVWVREGYKYTYYPFDPRTRLADFRHEAGTLPPLEKLQITDLVLQRTPSEPVQGSRVRVIPNERQVMAVFQKDARDYAVPVGAAGADDFRLYADEIFYLDDPHELYKHWPKDVWEAIAQRQVKPGMNELQASFAIGMGIPQPANGDSKTVNYPNGGRPLQITFERGRATDIKPQS